MATLFTLWLLVLFLPVACINLIGDSFDEIEIKHMGIKIQ